MILQHAPWFFRRGQIEKVRKKPYWPGLKCCKSGRKSTEWKVESWKVTNHLLKPCSIGILNRYQIPLSSKSSTSLRQSDNAHPFDRQFASSLKRSKKSIHGRIQLFVPFQCSVKKTRHWLGKITSSRRNTDIGSFQNQKLPGYGHGLSNQNINNNINTKTRTRNYSWSA